MKSLQLDRLWPEKASMKTVLLLMGLCLGLETSAQSKTPDIMESVKQYPDSLSLHKLYIKGAGLSPEELTAQYEGLMKIFPENATIPYALGESLWNKELPEARPFLLKAVELDPKLAKAYFYLWIDAERWGDFKKGQEYLLKAREIDQDNPDYAFYYASSFSKSDSGKYTKLSLEVVNKFPDSERGAQSLYWLATRSKSDKDKLRYFSLLKDKFPPAKFSWSASGMSGYYDLLLKSDPDKSLELAKAMLDGSEEERDQKYWKGQIEVAQNIISVNTLLDNNKPGEAYAVLEKTKMSRWSNAKNMVLLLKAKALNASEKTDKAYEVLMTAYAKSPETEIGEALHRYGTKLHKNKKTVENDIWAVRDAATEPATDFSLKQYFKPGKASLADFRGKVILLTYWFPGCGPCRGEFPHFQNVVDKFKGKDLVYLGINIVPEQNDYVIPFMKSSGYSFIPLEDYKEREKGNLDNRNAAPMNFLIDKKGNVVFSDFRTDGDNEEVLEEMIASLLNRDE
ncbi:redoxin domain-containing protein [Zhouia spongiae]|uniref:Redoxin domain-containing protein n=1 Tax=Zhouia spongiae TaxID=2202721 RepID=A0ABY3YN27_9FLAO|nr:TlpA disulfide reductase family protein [Zhouia spongiae]UNY98568.1 redoxin domain-containing protein [Zhouia spongiae]